MALVLLKTVPVPDKVIKLELAVKVEVVVVRAETASPADKVAGPEKVKLDELVWVPVTKILPDSTLWAIVTGAAQLA